MTDRIRKAAEEIVSSFCSEQDRRSVVEGVVYVIRAEVEAATAELRPYYDAVRNAHNGYDADARLAMPDLVAPSTPQEAIRSLIDEAAQIGEFTAEAEWEERAESAERERDELRAELLNCAVAATVHVDGDSEEQHAEKLRLATNAESIADYVNTSVATLESQLATTQDERDELLAEVGRLRQQLSDVVAVTHQPKPRNSPAGDERSDAQ